MAKLTKLQGRSPDSVIVVRVLIGYYFNRQVVLCPAFPVSSALNDGERWETKLRQDVHHFRPHAGHVLNADSVADVVRGFGWRREWWETARAYAAADRFWRTT